MGNWGKRVATQTKPGEDIGQSSIMVLFWPTIMFNCLRIFISNSPSTRYLVFLCSITTTVTVVIHTTNDHQATVARTALATDHRLVEGHIHSVSMQVLVASLQLL